MGIRDFLRRLMKAHTPEGTRLAMRRAYDSSRDRSNAGAEIPIPKNLPPGILGPPSHAVAMFEALASRYRAGGVSQERIQQRATSLWVEIAPFLYLDREKGIKALAEYVVWKEALEEFPETIDKVRVEWLRDRVREGVRQAEEVDPSGWVAGAKDTAQNLEEGETVWIRWVEFL